MPVGVGAGAIRRAAAAVALVAAAMAVCLSDSVATDPKPLSGQESSAKREVVPLANGPWEACNAASEEPSGEGAEAERSDTSIKLEGAESPELLPLSSRPTIEGGPSWGPPRDLFTYCDVPDYVSFNSILDEGENTDERYFLWGREEGQEQFQTSLEVEPGKTYEALIYFWNDVASHGGAVSENAFASLIFPDAANDQSEAHAKICADNAKPECVWAGMPITTHTGRTLILEPLDSQATITYGRGDVLHEIPLVDLFGRGSSIGCLALDGRLDGSAECQGFISFKFEAKEPESEVDLYVNQSDVTTAAKDPRETLSVELYLENHGVAPMDNLEFRIALPSGMRLLGPYWTSKMDESGSWGSSLEVVPDMYGAGSELRLQLEEGAPLGPGETVYVGGWAFVPSSSSLRCGGQWGNIEGTVLVDGVPFTDSVLVDFAPIC